MKAILVIDMPKNCMECPYRLNTNQYRCGVLVNDRRHTPKWTFREDVEKHRYSKCPLKPMPEKLDNPYDEEQGGYLWDETYLVGYNDCLDDILGDQE